LEKAIELRGIGGQPFQIIVIEHLVRIYLEFLRIVHARPPN
jgi:hypothetical protein